VGIDPESLCARLNGRNVTTLFHPEAGWREVAGVRVTPGVNRVELVIVIKEMIDHRQRTELSPTRVRVRAGQAISQQQLLRNFLAAPVVAARRSNCSRLQAVATAGLACSVPTARTGFEPYIFKRSSSLYMRMAGQKIALRIPINPAETVAACRTQYTAAPDHRQPIDGA